MNVYEEIRERTEVAELSSAAERRWTHSETLIKDVRYLLDENVHLRKEIEEARDIYSASVNVPEHIAKALNKLLTFYAVGYVFGQILMWRHVPEGDRCRNDEFVPYFKEVVKWRNDNERTFYDLMKNGYVVEKSEREKKIEQIIHIIGPNISPVAADLIYDLFQGDENK